MPLFYPLCLIMITISIFTALTSKNWTHIWLALEVNMMSFTPFMYSKLKKSSIAMLKYFFIQSLASMTFLLCILLHTYHYMNMISTIIIISMFTKLGLFPLFFWLPQISTSINWYPLLILLTSQKIIPLNILSLTTLPMIFPTLLLVSCLVSISGLWYQSSLKKLLAYSSMNHMSWMLSPLIFNKLIWPMYLLIYSFITFNMITFLKSHNFSSFYQFNPKININESSHLLLMMWSLGGMPPLLGFLPKWLTISNLNMNYNSLLIILIVSSLLSMVIYTTLCYPHLLSAQPPKTSKTYNNFPTLINIFSLLLITPTILY